MRKVLSIILVIICVFVSRTYSGNKLKTVEFVYTKPGVKQVDIVGNFGRGKKLAILSMLSVPNKNEWTISMNLKPDFYCYRYLVDKKHWRLDPNNTDVYETKIGNIEGKFSVLKIFPDNYESYLEISTAFLNSGKKEWAIKMLVQAARTFPTHVEVYKKLGELYEQDNSFGFAIDAYLAGVENNPADDDLKYLLAMCYEKTYEFTKDRAYKKKANVQWLTLKNVKKYYDTAKEYLSKQY